MASRAARAPTPSEGMAATATARAAGRMMVEKRMVAVDLGGMGWMVLGVGVRWFDESLLAMKEWVVGMRWLLVRDW